jgi:hypothetical protein
MRKSDAFLAFALCVLSCGLASAASHLWKINEVFSNADGTVQFLELHECCGAENETFMSGLEVTSDASGLVFRFPSHLVGPTDRKYLLLATKGFAAEPGAPAPDYTLPDGFIGLAGDTLWYSEARNYDRFVFKAGDLPLDGRQSINVTDYAKDAFIVGTNSPTNYSGETGSIGPKPPFTRGDCNADSSRDVSDAIFLLDAIFAAPQPFPCQDTCDTNDDGVIDVSDGVSILLFLFSGGRTMPEPTACGTDPTADFLGCAAFAACP